MAENKMSRADFLKLSAAGLATLAITPNVAAAKGSNDGKKQNRIRVAGVGIGGRGAGVLKEIENDCDIVLLCDTDHKYAATTFKRYPNAKVYWDWREMFEKEKDNFDAVVVGTPDHTHCIIAANAIVMGKHVYCEKPLTHTVYESRLLTKLAEKYGVATQMGNQGASGEGTALACDWIWNGEIGEVYKVESFTDRPIWPQGLPKPTVKHKVPKTLNWDLFIGPAPYRDYNEIYQPWNWRGWWDFGTGALGDMACHILHVPFVALNLGSPSTVQGSSTSLLTDCCPNAQMVKYTFPDRGRIYSQWLPEVELTWYDGGIKPNRPEGLKPGIDMNISGGCSIFYGTKDTLITGTYGAKPFLVSGRVPDAPKRYRRVPEGLNHGQDWLRACQEKAETRVKSNSDFSICGPFNEMVVMGVLGVRLQSLNKVLDWDGKNMKFTNIGPEETIRIMIEDGFSIKDGHPTFNKTYTDPINALEFANKMIKHDYREPWGALLPEMPL